jgi:hypothetical protein
MFAKFKEHTSVYTMEAKVECVAELPLPGLVRLPHPTTQKEGNPSVRGTSGQNRAISRESGPTVYKFEA